MNFQYIFDPNRDQRFDTAPVIMGDLLEGFEPHSKKVRVRTDPSWPQVNPMVYRYTTQREIASASR